MPRTTPAPVSAPTGIDIRAQRSRLGEQLFRAVCLVATLLPLLALVLLVGDVLRSGLPRLDLGFLIDPPRSDPARAGIGPALVGSIGLTSIAALVAVPLGIGAAIFLEEYRPRGLLSDLIEVTIANLAGVPSVIYGLLGLGLFVRLAAFGSSLLAGGCTLALLVLPLVIMAAREALRSVPTALREAAFALGATRWRVVRDVVLPLALPGTLTGIILALSRTVGVTAPLIVVGAAAFITFAPSELSSPFTALPVQIYRWVATGDPAFEQNASAAVLVLLALLLSLNAAAIYLRIRQQKRYFL